MGRCAVSPFSQFFLDLGGSYLVGRNRSCTALHRSKDRESNGKPPRVSGDKLVEFITLSTISLANCFFGNGARNACWHFLCPIRIDILQAHRITAVALHLGVFQCIVFSSGKHYGKEYRKSNDNCTSLINRLIRRG